MMKSNSSPVGMALIAGLVSIIQPKFACAQDPSPNINRTKTVKILSPSDGEIVRPGSKITVKVQAESSIEMISVIIVPESSYKLLYSGNFKSQNVEFTQAIPKDLRQSTLKIAAIGKPRNRTDNSRTMPVDGKTLKVVADAALNHVKIYPDDIIILKGKSENLSITGTFSDGVEREVSDLAAYGVRLVAANPSLVNVSGQKIEGLKEGETTITAQKGSVTLDSYPVQVLPSNAWDSVDTSRRQKTKHR